MNILTLLEVLLMFLVWGWLVWCVYYFLDRSLDQLALKSRLWNLLPEAFVAFALTWLSMILLGVIIKRILTMAGISLI